MLVRQKKLDPKYTIQLIRLLPRLNARSFTKFRDGEMNFQDLLQAALGIEQNSKSMIKTKEQMMKEGVSEEFFKEKHKWTAYLKLLYGVKNTS